MKDLRVALQLYTVRGETERDFAGTLRSVAGLGYAGVEFAGYGGLSAPAMVDLLAETGLGVAGAHLGLDALSEEQLEASLTYARAIGCPTVVLPWLTDEWRTPEGLATLAPRLNVIGQRCREAGLTFAYHNHDFEFVSHAGRTLYDTLLTATDPALVKIELDVYWAAFAGHDPLTLLNRLDERVALIHFKDMAADRSMTEVGQGTLDMPGIASFAQAHGLWAIVEHDHPTLPALQSARVSVGYFG